MNEQNLTFLGPGILLLFFSLKHIRMTLVLLLMSYGIFSLITNIIGSLKVDLSVCSKDFFLEELLCKLNLTSTFDLKESLLLRNFQLWMGFFLSIVWFFSLTFINYIGEKKDKDIDDFLDSASDYTIKI